MKNTNAPVRGRLLPNSLRVHLVNERQVLSLIVIIRQAIFFGSAPFRRVIRKIGGATKVAPLLFLSFYPEVEVLRLRWIDSLAVLHD